MKSLKLGVALAIAAAAVPGTAEAAQIVTTGDKATTVQVATLDPGVNNNFTIGFSDSGLANPFDEFLTFTTDVGGILNIFFGTTATDASNNTNFTNAFLSGTGITTPISIAQFTGDPNETRALNNFQIAAGTYTLNILGTPGTSSGAFGGTVSFTAAAAAVPEPATWAMMLLGFGAIGFSMRRRQRHSAHLYQVA